MSAIWDPGRPELDLSQIVVAAPVASRHWRAGAGLSNFLRGKGACLVPTCAPNRTITKNVTETFRFYVKTRSSAIQRIWLIGVRSGGTVPDLFYVFAPSGGTSHTYTSRDLRQTFIVVEDLASKAIDENEIAIDVKAGPDESLIVETIACYEQDRAILNADATDLGVAVTSVAPGQPIFDASNASMGGIIDALAGADARRVGILHWTCGADTSYWTSSASYVDLFPFPIPVLARKLYRTDTTSAVYASVYAKVTGGVGKVQITTTESGVGEEIEVTDTTFKWTAPVAFAIHCDDMASDDGRQTAATPVWDELQIAYQGDGFDAITIQAVSVWEA